MEQEQQQPFTPYELYCEVQRMRAQVAVLCTELSRVSLALENSLALPGTQALEAALRGDRPQPPAPDPLMKAAPPLDVEAWLKGAIKAVLSRADRALNNSEVRKQLQTLVEQNKYCAPSKHIVNKTLHAMAQEGTLWCEKRQQHCYWSLADCR